MSRLSLVFWKIINHQFWCGPQMITFSRSGPLLPALGTKDCTCDRHGRLNVLIRHFFWKPFPAGDASRTTRYTRKMDIPNHDMLIYQQYKQPDIPVLHIADTQNMFSQQRGHGASDGGETWRNVSVIVVPLKIKVTL